MTQATETPKVPTTTEAAAETGLTRRRLLGTAAAAAGVVSWSNLTIISKARAQSQTLRVLAWPGYDELPVVGPFQDAHGVTVEFKNYIGGEQMLQFYAQTPPGTFDAIIADAEYVQKFTAQNALAPLTKADFPALAEFHPTYADFPLLRAPDDKTWGIGTRFSFYGISYNTNHVSEEETQSWESLFLPKFTNKVVMFDWYLPNMSNASLAVFPNNPTPYDLTGEQLAQVKEWMFRLRPQINSFAPQNQGLVSALVNEDAIITPYGDMDIEMTVAGYDNFKSTVPKEGSIRWSEAACLCADSANQELALEWIKYMSTAEVQSKLVYTKGFKARAPNMKVVDFWDDEQKTMMKYVPDPANPGQMIVETLLDLTAPRGLPVQQPEADWQAIYNEFKSA